jgi:hypothetical protein
MFKLLGIGALVCAGGGVIVLATHLRKPGQPGWDAWTMLAWSVLGAAVSGIGLLLLV